MTVFIQYLVNGLSMGSVYAIIALGYTMVYGIAKMLNFAHGDVIMVGAYISFCAASYLGLPGWASVILSCVVCTVLGVLIEGLAYKPLRQAGPLAVLITAIGVSYFLQNAAQLLWGATPKNFTSLVTFPVPEFLAKFNVSAVSLVTIVACLVIMAGLMFFTGKTKMGKAMRAVSEDKAAAQLMGINVNRTISMTFAIGSALAAIAGVLLCSYSPVLQPTTGAMPGIKAFDAAVFGGIGSIPGAFVGGILIGIIEAMAQAYISTSLANSIVFGVLIIVLLVKPAGLLGKSVYQVNRMGIARTFQNIRLFNTMTVEDNVKVGLHNQERYSGFEGVLRLPTYWKHEKAAHERAMELLSIFDMEHLANEQAGSLPYGAQRRLEIVRALATNPKLLLLDEPAAGMNPSETAELMENIVKIRDTFGIAIMLIEHDMSLVMNICEGICVLNCGKVIAKGTAEEIQNNDAVIEAYLGKQDKGEN